MIQPWINNAKWDTSFILLPPFYVLGLILIFENQIIQFNNLYFWLFLVVFVDVAHVYSSLFKTYFHPNEKEYFSYLFYIVPIISFVLGLMLYQIGENSYWRAMAYIALYHFIRQQYGFYKLYCKSEDNYTWLNKIGVLAIYSATIHPVIYWFFGEKRNFNWFVENDFYHFPIPLFVTISWVVFGFIQISYIISQIYLFIQNKSINIPKNLVWLGTLLSWNLGIIFFNNDVLFSLFNIISHGIPYMALVFFNTFLSPNTNHNIFAKYTSSVINKLVVFIVISTTLAFIEEFIWDYTVWKEHFFETSSHFSNYLWVIVPLLSVPQLTHYILDGFIWKRKINKNFFL